jgi:Tol biopolymer transport system component
LFTLDGSDGMAHMHLINAAGGTPVPVGPPREGGGGVWSPDGAWVALTVLSGKYAQLALIRPDGTGFRELTTHASNNSGPVWAPDGTRIAFSTDRNGDRDIAVLDVATGDVSVITSGPGSKGSPRWTPDGTALLFSASGATGNTLMTVSVQHVLGR